MKHKKIKKVWFRLVVSWDHVSVWNLFFFCTTFGGGKWVGLSCCARNSISNADGVGVLWAVEGRDSGSGAHLSAKYLNWKKTWHHWQPNQAGDWVSTPHRWLRLSIWQLCQLCRQLIRMYKSTVWRLEARFQMILNPISQFWLTC